MTQKVLVIGGATTDSIICYEDMETLVHHRRGEEHAYLILEEGKKIEVTRQQVFTGGGATNAAVSFLRQGYDTQLFCKLGKDTAGQFVIDRLHSFGLDTGLIIQAKSAGTANSFIVPSLRGDRVVFAYRGANALLTKEELPLMQIAEMDFIYVSSLSQQSAEQLLPIIEAANKHNVPVAINPGVSQLNKGAGFVARSLSGIDILVLNLEEAEALMQSLKGDEGDKHVIDDKQLLDIKLKFEDSRFNLREFFKTTLDIGPRIVAVTNGKGGVYVATGACIYYHRAHLTEKIANTVGAGDAFGSSFVGAIYSGKSVEDAIRYGIVNGKSVVEHVDAKTGLLTAEALQEQAAKLPKADLQII